LDQSWQVGEQQFLHIENIHMSDGIMVPFQARLKSSGLSIGDLAGLTGVRTSAIRYYEASGLLPAPARRSGQRLYDLEAVKRLRTIVVARGLGFSIREIKALSVIDIRARREVAQAKASSLRILIAELGTTATRLDELSNCDCVSGSACRLL
jgi:MerR family redox-sensitive transcriptional activator SoxR